MKRMITITALASVFSLAQAAPLYHPPGPNLIYGAVSNGQTIMSDITNPAAGAAVLQQEGNQYRFGIPGSIGGGFEFGQVDDLYNLIDAEADKFQSTQNLTNISTAQDAVDEINAALSSLNTVLAEVETNGYAKAFASLDIPLVIAHQGLGGSLSFDFNKSFATRATGLHETVTFNSVDALNGIDDPNDDISITFVGGIPTGFSVDNDSSILIKASMVTDLSLGYSRPVFKTNGATLYAGARVHHYTLEQSRLAVRMTALNDVEQQFKDALDQDRSSDTGMGVDLGVLWISEHYRAGATLTNINEPDFDTGDIDLTGYDLTSSVAQRLISENSYTMEKQLTLEAALYTASQNWVLSAAMDANAVKDPLGDEYQWATLSAAYATDSWWLPGIRAGYRTNRAGSKISYYSLGTTLAMVNLDVAWSADEVTIDGSTVPRGAIFNVGLELSF
ncbi:conjugal transfer protein TraF [Beggiatoa alba]|nr:conjugal transfer protein TraF [Beggiatoa alba]